MSETYAVEQDFAVEYTDIRDGIIVDYGDGREIEIPPHSERVYLEMWANGFIEVLFYSEPQPDEDPSDRIHLIVHGFGGERRGFLMNAEDATAMIHGLSTGIQRAIAAGVPLKPEAV
jgi:hypothetical protein